MDKNVFHINNGILLIYYKENNVICKNIDGTDEWIKKVWSLYTMEYYLATKKNGIMPHEATWMELQIILLSEVGQT